jgi:hypothetical protein
MKGGRGAPLKVPPAGQQLFWGRAQRPAYRSLTFTGFATDPNFRALGAFGEVQQIALGKAAGVLPVAIAGFVRACKINAVEAVVIPDCCGDKSDFDFVVWLV